MALRSRHFSFIFLLLVTSSIVASNKLPLFITKQDIRNIRYISYDGDMTYYQRSNGSLQLSTNYKVKEVLKRKEKSQYLVYVSPSKKYTMISHQEEPFMMASSRWMNELHFSEYGKLKTTLISQGIFISFLGQGDRYFSYYVPTKKVIVVVESDNLSKKVQFQIVAGMNPYFLPKVAMIDSNRVIFTDLNRLGISGLRVIDLKTLKTNLFYKAQDSTSKLDICSSTQELFIWESSYNDKTKGTRITKVPYKDFSRDKQSFVYQSSYNDLGSLKCHKGDRELYFVKSYDKSGKFYSDVAKHDIKTGKTELMSNLKYATSLINLDGRLLIPFQGKFYSLDKKNDLTEVDRLQEKKDGEKN